MEAISTLGSGKFTTLKTANLIKPHAGPQEMFLATPADIAIYGGSAGGGKTWSLLVDPLRWLSVPGFGWTIFRRTSVQVKNEGGLWDAAARIYPQLGGLAREYDLTYRFTTGAKCKFANMEHEKDKDNYQGAEIGWIGFDELTHFTEGQFFYLLSRNRTTCGIRPCVRATCNPDCDSWVAEFLSWWIDQETGYAIDERSGKLRWMYHVKDRVYWYNSKREAMAAWAGNEDVINPVDGSQTPPKSVTFIAAKLEDNPTLMTLDPGYRANLMALPLVDRERLLRGNWKIRPTAGLMFKREWMSKFVDRAPTGKFTSAVRYWDLASSTDGDETAGVLIVRSDGRYYIADCVHGKWTTGERDKIILATAELDQSLYGGNVELWQEKQPGAAGKDVAYIEADRLIRFSARFAASTGSKIDRAKPLSAAFENGLVSIVRGPWNKVLCDQLANFPPDKNSKASDDIVDGCSGAFNRLILAPEVREVEHLPVGARLNGRR